VTERAKEFMNAVWECRNNGADTEEKLVSAVLLTAANFVRTYNAQNDLIVLDKDDLLKIAEELYELNQTQ
jgi:hypothetical protein